MICSNCYADMRYIGQLFTGFNFGKGEHTYRCESCGHEKIEIRLEE
jgi:hypothetical protein